MRRGLLAVHLLSMRRSFKEDRGREKFVQRINCDSSGPPVN